MLDEIQMISNLGRGWAWTRALLGLPAEQLHVCGDPAVLPLLERLADECGDKLTVRAWGLEGWGCHERVKGMWQPGDADAAPGAEFSRIYLMLFCSWIRLKTRTI